MLRWLRDKQPKSHNNPYHSSLKQTGLGVLLVLISSLAINVYTYTRADLSGQVYAAGSSELNFQARLQNASGTIVADGSYSVQFKLYDAATAGTNEWTETQTVTVRAGYLSVYLGSVTPFGSSIDWSQDQYLTMNINADGEMNPRIKLTAVPYAFRSAQADGLTSGSSIITAAGLAQLGPNVLQTLSSTVAGLRINQTGTGGLLQFQTNGSDMFTVANNGDGYFKGSLNLDGASLDIGSGTQAGSLVLEDGSGTTGSFALAGNFVSNRTYTLPDASGTVCLTTTCGGAANAIINGGNLFGANTTLGTNDNYDLSLRTNNQARLTILRSGNVGIGEANPLALLSVGTGSAFQVNNTGDITGGGLSLSGAVQIGGTSVLTSGRALQNVTASTSILTSGTLGTARGGTGVDGSTATNGQLLIGNGSGFALGSLSNNGGLTITPGAGTLGLAVNYGSTSTSAVRGDTALTCASGTGNLSGGGSIITLGSGGSCGTLSTVANPTFSTSVTSPLFTNAGALTLSTSGVNDLTITSGSGTVNVNAATLKTTSALTIDLNNATNQAFSLVNNGTGTASLNLVDGGLQVAGTTVLTNGAVLQNVTANTSILTSGTLGTARGGTGIDTSTAGNGQLLLGTGSGLALGTLANNGGLTITPGSGSLGLAVNYGNTSTSAVRGDTALTCTSGAGNLSGGGTTITLGSGGSCGALSTVANPTFGTSVTSPLFTNAGTLTLSTSGLNDLTITSGSGVINMNTSTIKSTVGLTYDLSSASNLTFALNNSGSGTASLNLVDGGLQLNSTLVLSSARVLSNLTGITSSGTITFGSLASGGLVKTDTSGNLLNAIAGTDYELPLSFGNGLTRTGNGIALGGSLTAATSLGLNGNALTVNGSGSSTITALAAGGLQIKADSSAALSVSSTTGISYYTVNTNGNLVQIGSSTTDGTAILSVLDSYNGATDPAGVNGAQYYNSSLNKFRCYQNNTWKDCISEPTIRSFVSSTVVGVVDANTTNYWRTATENNNSYPNITPSQASGKAIMGIVTMETTSTSNNDVEVSARIERGIGAIPTCGTGTTVGAQPGTFSSNNGGQKASTVQFVDIPNTTSPVYYVVCSDTATVNTGANVTRLRVTLQEVNNSN